jgi:uncharacterized protein YqeY
MSLQEKIDAQIKEAMKAKKQDRLAALRAVKSEILLLQTSGSKGSDEDEVKMLQKLVKQRKESAELYESQNRLDLAEPEIFQADVIAEFLPKQLTDEELTHELHKIIEETGAHNTADMGKVMGVASKKLAGKAEGKLIANKVRDLLSD